MKTKTVVLNGKPDAGNPHVRFDEGEVASYPPTVGRPEGGVSVVRAKAGKIRFRVPSWSKIFAVADYASLSNVDDPQNRF